MTHTVVGLFDDKGEAQAAMTELVQQGFIKEDIDLSNKSASSGARDDAADSMSDIGTGIGDRIGNFFSSLFDDDETTARNYTNAAGDADAILTVQVDSDDRARTAQEIFDRHGAIDVDEHGAQYSEQNFAGGRSGNENFAGNRADSNTDKTIPVVEERLNVSKREVESGGARIRSRIIEKPVEEHIRLREEHVVVNRHPVDREVTDADMRNFQPGEMEITERSEVPIVGKQARVVEEIEIGKNVSERDETISDSVRRTEVDVEEFDADDDLTGDTRARGAKP